MHILSLRLVALDQPTHWSRFCIMSFSPSRDNFLHFETAHLRTNDYLAFLHVSLLSRG